MQPLDYVFPFQQEMISVLRSAIKANPMDARAPYYLGNLLYDWQPEEAIALWEKSTALDPGAPIAWRNLGVAYSHQTAEGSKSKAVACLEKATKVPNPYPTHFAELDQLYKSEGIPVEKRLAVLEENQGVVVKKDEALGAMVNLKVFSGKTDEAIRLLKSRTFSIWEGSNAFNTGQAWADAYLVKGLALYNKKSYREALGEFQTALKLPGNLRSEISRIASKNQVNYWIGCAYAALGEKEKAVQSWNEVVSSESQPKSTQGRRGGNPQEQKYFVTMAKQKLGLNEDTKLVFEKMSDLKTNMDTEKSGGPDYQFINARKLPSRENQAMPHYIAGLGYSGLGNKEKAREEFQAALAISPDYLNAKIALSQL